jgi:hypothetical protein
VVYLLYAALLLFQIGLIIAAVALAPSDPLLGYFLTMRHDRYWRSYIRNERRRLGALKKLKVFMKHLRLLPTRAKTVARARELLAQIKASGHRDVPAMYEYIMLWDRRVDINIFSVDTAEWEFDDIVLAYDALIGMNRGYEGKTVPYWKTPMGRRWATPTAA